MSAMQRPVTYRDLLERPDPGLRREAIQGELIKNPALDASHQRVLGRLFRLFDDHVRQTRAGEVFLAPFDVVLGHYDIVQPDLIYLSAARSRVPGNQFAIEEAPDALVEVISPGTGWIDSVRKMALYARSRIPEYWIAHPGRQLLVVNVLEGEDYRPIEPDADGTIASREVSGLRVDPEQIFANLN